MKFIKRSIIILVLIFSLIINILGVKADSNYGMLPPTNATGSGGGGGGVTNFWRRQPFANGYRVSLVNTSGGRAQYKDSAGKVHTTYSVDYWSDNRNVKECNEYGKNCLLGITGFHALTYNKFGGSAENNNIVEYNIHFYYGGPDSPKLDRQELLWNNPSMTTAPNSLYTYSNGQKQTDTRYTKIYAGLLECDENNIYSCTMKENKYNKMNKNMTYSNGNAILPEPGSYTDHSYVYLSPYSGSLNTLAGNYFANNAAKAILDNFLENKNPDLVAFNKFFVNCGYQYSTDPATNIAQAFKDEISIQIEPVEAIRFNTNYSGSSDVFVGTMAEIFKMISNAYSTKTNSYVNYFGSIYASYCGKNQVPWSWSIYTDLHPIMYAQRNDIDISKSRYYKAGIKLIDKESASLCDAETNESETTSSKNYGEEGYGVSIFFLPDYKKNEDCKTTAHNNINAINNEIISSKESYYNFISGNSTDSIFNKDDAKYKDYMDTCFTGGVDASDDEYGLNMHNCYQISYDYVTKVAPNLTRDYKITDSNNDLCKPRDCQGTIDKLTYATADLSNKNSDFSKAIAHLFSIKKHFSDYTENDDDYDFLRFEVYNDMLNTVPSCSGLPICNASMPSMECPESNDDKKPFTISDRDSSLTDAQYNECKLLEVAYSGQSPNGKMAQSSKDKNYSNNTVLCEESVSFDLPGQPEEKDGIAGKILGWGISSDVVNDGIFGTMKVTKNCLLNPTTKTEDKKPFDNKDDLNVRWIYDDVKTEIKLKYAERGSAKEYFDGINMDLILSNVNVAYGNDSSIKFYTEENVNEYKNISCSSEGNDCSSYTFINTEATYTIAYPTGLAWYADKTRNGIPITVDKIVENPEEVSIDVNDLPASYVPLGYGIMTYFNDPNCTFGQKTMYGKAKDDSFKAGDLLSDDELKDVIKEEEKITDWKTAAKNGLLKISITKIGTMTDREDASGQKLSHFDTALQLVKEKDSNVFEPVIKDSENNGVLRSKDFVDKRKSLEYSCPFKVQNKLFGSEYGTDEYCNPDDGNEDKPTGLDVVFRTVKLMDASDLNNFYEAFPGRAGETRMLGENWFKLSYGEKFNLGAFYNILSSDVYNEDEPMYHIELTPSKIKEIRKDNNARRKAHTYIYDTENLKEFIDPYTYMGKYNGDDTYLFKKFSLMDEYLAIYDFEGDKSLDMTDSSKIMYCNKNKDDPDCENVRLSLDDAEAISDIYMNSGTGTEFDEILGIHASSIYLDELREKYGLKGVCTDGNAEQRLEKYSRMNGCHYADKNEVYIYSGPSYYEPIHECMIRSKETHEVPKTFAECFDENVGENYFTEVKYSASKTSFDPSLDFDGNGRLTVNDATQARRAGDLEKENMIMSELELYEKNKSKRR